MFLSQNKNKKMNDFLIQVYKIATKLGNDISTDTVYYHLTRGNISNNDRSFNVNNLFPRFIENFKNKANTNAFVESNWKYFCQFVNRKNFNNRNLSNAIKMYLSVGSKDIEKVANIIFDFIDKEGIIHESKIGSEIRSDDIVIRVYSKEDEIKIRNFINKNNYIKSSLNSPIPFSFENNGIGYAIDRELSYNCTVCKYISNYINDSIKNNKKVSLDGFYNYVLNIYKNVFINSTGILEYSNKYMYKEKGYFNSDFLLNNYYEVTKLLLTSIKSNKFSDYLGLVDEFNDTKKYESRLNHFSNSTLSKKDILLFNEYIITMVKKYGEQLGLNLVDDYVVTGDIMRVTRTNNLRNKFMEGMSHKKSLQILSGLSVKDYYYRLIQKEISNNDDLNNKMILLNNAIILTFQKYGYDQTFAALVNACKNNFNYFTNDLNARDNLISNLTVSDINIIINNATGGVIDKYLKGIISSLNNNVSESKKR